MNTHYVLPAYMLHKTHPYHYVVIYGDGDDATSMDVIAGSESFESIIDGIIDTMSSYADWDESLADQENGIRANLHEFLSINRSEIPDLFWEYISIEECQCTNPGKHFESGIAEF